MGLVATMMFLLDEQPKELWNEVCVIAILRDVAGGATVGIKGFTLLHQPTGPRAPSQFDGPGDVECAVKTRWWGLVDEQPGEEHMDIQPSVCLAMIVADEGGDPWETLL